MQKKSEIYLRFIYIKEAKKTFEILKIVFIIIIILKYYN